MTMPGYAIQSVDLAMTRYVGTASSVPLESADSWGSLDLQVVTGKARTLRDATFDLGTVAERANLGQALILRLLTEQGALAPLGHPDYGCRLISLIGRTNDQATRNLARLYVIEAARQEPRVKALESLSVETAPGQPDTLRIAFAATPLNDDDPIALTLDVAL
jgi:phage baseplate assembly protein W